MIPGLDGLRAIAVLAVLAFHVNGYYFGFGWLGVQFFFVLSGFLITGILVQMKETLPVKQYFNKFYGRRFLRIFPVYYFYLLVLTVFIWLDNLQFLEPLQNELQTLVRPQLPYAFFYIYDFFYASSAHKLSSYLTHFWSLSVEEQFYIIWPLLLLLTPKKKIKTLFLLTIILGPIFRLIIYFIFTTYDFPFLVKNPYLAIYALPFSHVDAFAMGAYVSQFQISRYRKQLIFAAGMVPLFGYLSQYLVTGIIDPGTFGYEFKMWTGYKFIWGYSLLNYFFALILYNVYRSKLFVRILEHSVLRYLGKISYGIYIYHVAILHVISFFVPADVDSRIHPVLYYIFAVVVTTVIASISFYLLEKPITELKNKFFPLD